MPAWVAVATLLLTVLGPLPGAAHAATDGETGTGGTDAASAQVWLLLEPGPAAAAIEAGAMRAAGSLGMDLEVAEIRAGGTAQADALRRAVEEGRDGIAVAVGDPDDLRAGLEALQGTDVPIVIVGHGLMNWQSLGADGFVGQDEALAGEAAARWLLEAGVEQGLCVQDLAADSVLQARCRAAVATMEAGGAGMDVLYALDPPGDPTGVRDAIVARAFLDPTIDGVLATEDDGLREAVEARARWPEGRDVAIGAIVPRALARGVEAAIEAGDLQFVIDQQPSLQGSLAMRRLLALIDGSIAEGSDPVIVEPRVIDLDDLD